MTESKLIIEEMDFATFEARLFALISKKTKMMTPLLIEEFKKWLGPKGIRFFRLCKFLKGTVSPVFILKTKSGDKVPYPIHFNEGMQIRNWMRTRPEFKDFTDHDFDNTWMALIEKAIKKEKI